jgi:MFS family permease
MLCFAVFQPFGGLLADRYNRKSIMVWTNWLQVILALSFLLIRGAEDIVWIYFLTGSMMILHGMYVTAERAALPNIVPEKDLPTANALDAASWSTALCTGAMLGGVVVELYGTNAAFIIDAFTFAVSAILLRKLTIPQTVEDELKGPLLSTALKNIRKGWTRIFGEKRLLRIVFAKSSWNIAGGGLAGVFLLVAGSDIDGFGMALGFGIFFFARGIGTGIGPIVSRRFFVDEERWPVLVGLLVSVSGAFYFLVGWTLGFNLYLTVVLVILAHSASGANWVLSTILTQQWVEDEIRGRVFSMDMLMMSIAFSVSSAVAGYLLENDFFNLKQGFIIFSIIMVVSGIFFTLWRPDAIKGTSQ